MKKTSLTLLLFIAAAFSLCSASTAIGQTPTPSTREALIQTLKERAQHDAKVGRPASNAQELSLLFGDQARAAAVTLQEVTTVYDEAYSAAKGAEPWWRNINPSIGWLAAIVLFVLLIFRDSLKDTITSGVNWTKNYLYNVVAGHRIFRRAALRRYRQALISKYEKLKVPFRPDQPLDVRQVYVPLKVKGGSDIEEVDALGALVEHKVLMVVGSPGSGKSMLLRHVSLAYADGRLPNLANQPIPILLELNRLNAESTTIEDQLIEVMRLNDFPKANNFVQRGLKNGSLMLLFDGLDEVNTLKREQVVAKIKDLIDTYKDCRAVITCRTAVYRNEFAAIVDQTLEIIEFTDQQIQSFLGAWERYMPKGKTIEQLILTLRERPRILALARNPLLLTIIAYLYTDTEFILPHSRAEFYDKAVNILLDQWKGEANSYKAPHKRLVLQHLALFNQDRGVEGDEDRRSIDLTTIIEEIKRVLPQLNLEPKEAEPLLEEIVHRSGLMISIDGGARFQFAHLTLQEFFAATALRNDASALVNRFKKDRDAWRETVKLWCGLDLDSTLVVSEIEAIDPITAFECLADAQKIGPGLAENIINSFKSQLGSNDATADAVLAAFAGVASGFSPRSKGVFKFLVEALENNEGPQMAAAAKALSLTNQPSAVQALTDHYGSTPAVRTAIVRMGDLAVKSLTTLAEAGNAEANEDLQAIGTPLAGAALASFLWSGNFSVSLAAAYHLAALLPQKSIEDTLRHCAISAEARGSVGDRWVWEPFNEPANSSLPIIAGRIAYLTDEAERIGGPPFKGQVDARIAIPLIVRMNESRPGMLRQVIQGPKYENLYKQINRIPDASVLNHETVLRQPDAIGASRKITTAASLDAGVVESINQFFDYLWKDPVNQPIIRMFQFLDPLMQLDLLRRLVDRPTPTVYDWTTASRKVDYQGIKPWQIWSMLLFMASMSVGTMVGMFIVFRSAPWISWNNGLILFSLLVISAVWVVVVAEGLDDDEAPLIALSGPVLVAYMSVKHNRVIDGFGTFLLLTAFVLFVPVNAYFTYFVMRRYHELPLWQVFAGWLTIVALTFTLYLRGEAKKRAFRNPLRSLMDGSTGKLSF